MKVAEKFEIQLKWNWTLDERPIFPIIHVFLEPPGTILLFTIFPDAMFIRSNKDMSSVIKKLMQKMDSWETERDSACRVTKIYGYLDLIKVGNKKGAKR